MTNTERTGRGHEPLDRSEVGKAEQEVRKSAAGFETAMEHLGGTIESRTAKVRGGVDRVSYALSAPKRAFAGAKARSIGFGRDVRANPAPAAIGAGLLLGVIIGGVYGAKWGLWFRR